jgi:hypothetical protein
MKDRIYLGIILLLLALLWIVGCKLHQRNEQVENIEAFLNGLDLPHQVVR